MRKKHHPRKHLPAKLLLTAVLIIAVFGLYKYQQYNYLISTPVDPNNQEETIFTIKKGDNLKTIAAQLSKESLILDQDSFNWYGRLSGQDKQVKTGRFPLKQSLTTSEIYNVITSNDVRQEIVTIPEGSTIQDIDRILVELSIIQPEDFTIATQNFQTWDKYPFLDSKRQAGLPHPLEGYLFPDTYYVTTNNFSTEDFLSLLLNTFQKKAVPVLQKSGQNLTNTVIVASMIEKEANKSPDRPIIAGIIWKRLEENWVLGIDATLLYLKNDREIDYQDLQENSPYNTRKFGGLPPGPICNPGLASLQAAAEPEVTPYYFYLTSADGKMIYAITNEEHNRNKSLL